MDKFDKILQLVNETIDMCKATRCSIECRHFLYHDCKKRRAIDYLISKGVILSMTQKPEICNNDKLTIYRCPNCKCHLNKYQERCIVCGEKIDWEQDDK